MSVETKPNRLTKGLVLDTFHTDVDNTVATYALNSQLEDQEGNHFHYGSEVGTNHIKDIPDNHVVIGHINMERNETVLFTTDGTNSTIGILSRNDDMSYNYEIKVDDTDQKKKLNFKKNGYVRGVYRLLNGCDKVIYFVDGVNKDRRVNFNKLDSYKDPASTASGIIFDDSLKATIYALSSATGNIQLIRLLSASPEATASVLANLSSGAELTKLLTASANGIGTAFANLIRTANIFSSIEATGTSTVNVDIVRLLQSNVSAIGSANAILESTQQGLVEVTSSVVANSTVTADILRIATLASSPSTAADTSAIATLTRVLEATATATANTDASAQLTIPVNASTTATAETSANAQLSYTVNAEVTATAQTSADAFITRIISANATAMANSSAEAGVGVTFVAAAVGVATSTNATLSRTATMSASATASGSITAASITTVDNVAASVSGAATVSATLNVAAPLLLDLYPNAAVAYSLRKLRNAYTGSAIRARANTSGAEGDVSFDVNNTISASSTVTVTAVGTSGLSIGQQVTFSTFWNAGGSNQNVFVTTWYDQSGNANNATMSTQANQPQIVSSGSVILTNGKPSVTFDGTNDSLNLSSSLTFANTGNLISFVGKRAASGDRLYSLSGSKYLYTLWSDNLYYLQSNTNGYQVSTNTDITTNQLLLSGVNNGTNQIIYKNNSIVNSNFATDVITSGISNIGKYVDNVIFIVKANLQEIIFYNSENSTNLNGINTNINTHYGIY